MTKLTCDVCSKSFKLPSLLVQHFRTHSKERPLLCRFCGLRMSLLSNLRRHEKKRCRYRHAEQKDAKNNFEIPGFCQCQKCSKCRRRRRRGSNTDAFYCDNCDNKWFSCVEGLTYHLRKKHLSERSPQCDDCGNSFISQHLLGQHVADSHLTDKAAIFAPVCYDCEKTFSSLKNLQEHVKNVHNQPKRKFKCSVCLKNYVRYSDLKSHNCANNRPFNCDVCEKKLKDKRSFIEHSVIAHVSTQIDIPERQNANQNETKIDVQRLMIKCSKCIRWFPTWHWLRHHERQHAKLGTSVVEYQRCRICDKRFSTIRSLQRHMRKHESRQRFRCSLCKRDYSKAGNLTRHLEMQHGDYKIVYQCDLCDKAYTQKFYLVLHTKLSHIGDRDSSVDSNDATSGEIVNGRAVYQCSQCVQRFSSMDDLHRHQLMHRKNRPRFSCQYCTMTTFIKGNLYSHERNMHSIKSQQRFSCYDCERSFSQLKNLPSHILAVHASNRTYLCDTCEKVCPHQSHFIWHVRKSFCKRKTEK